MSDSSSSKIPLPVFLKMLTSNNIPASKAMGVAGKIYKSHNTSAALAQLTDSKLRSEGVDDKEDRKLTLAAIKKAGYKKDTILIAGPNRTLSIGSRTAVIDSPSTSSSHLDVSSPRKKRKRDVPGGELLLPDGPPDESATYGSLEFNEILSEEDLMSKSTVVNRAPIMTAWSFIVAERLGFQREEALSIASVYTEMNAISKGVSIGLYEENKQQNMEASKDGSQPYVDLMGRRIPLYQTSSGQWRALTQGSPVSPGAAFSYITRSLRQTTPQIMGALRLVALSYSPAQLNKRGYNLYCDFRPNVEGWGKKGEVRCQSILAMRRKPTPNEVNLPPTDGSGPPSAPVKMNTSAESSRVEKPDDQDQEQQSDMKRARTMTLEEYEAALDAEDIDDATLASLP